MDPVEEIKARLDIVDVVQEYLPMKPAGTGSFKGLCPFHQEKSPSFFANRARQSWHCFGCAQGGDAISFVMRMEGMEFPEALELLANKTGVQLPKFDPQKSSEKKRLHEINDLAAHWFRYTLLKDPRAEYCRDYVTARGIDVLTGDLWMIGYAPNSWDGLTNALKAKGISDEELLKAGLVSKSERSRGVYDRFRDRLMISIYDIHGNAVGFTGRLLPLAPQLQKDAQSNEQGAKYVNTPETPVYKKSSILFGLDKAKGEIKRQDLAIIVEGNMDALTSHQFGVTNVVASSGTALTEDQLKLLKRFTNNLIIAFDQDSAGKAATIRGLDIARKMDFNIKVISLPDDAGKDPDEAIRKDINIWKDAIRQAQGLLEWLYKNAFKNKSAARPEEKKLIARDLLPEFQRIADAVERDAWIKRLADDLAVSADALRQAIKPASSNFNEHKTSSSPAPKAAVNAQPNRDEQLRDRLLAILLLQPKLEALAKSLLKGYNLPLNITAEQADFLAILADREFEDQAAGTLQKELETVCTILYSEYRTRERQRLEQEMRQAENQGDAARIQDLLAQFNNL
jgi:DNA primase